MWKPLVRRSGDEWVGITDEAGIWVGTGQFARARVELMNPTSLWHLLERGRSEVCEELQGAWSDFERKGVSSADELVEAIVTSAVRGWQPYWVNLAVDWIQEMDEESGYRVEDLRALLSEVAESPSVGQAIRHKAGRILRQFHRAC